MSDDREREHCERVAEEWRSADHFRRKYQDWRDVATIIQKQRAAATAEARDKDIGELSFWHAQANADWNESPTDYRDGVREGYRLAMERIRALRGGGR